MSNIVNLNRYRQKVQTLRIFSAWQRRFRQTFQLNIRLADLPETTLLALARPGDHSAEACHELIMGVLDLGDAAQFSALDDRDKLTVVDTHLFLADHVHFEIMRRLNWLQRHPCLDYPIVSLVRQAIQLRQFCATHAPALAASHPDYPAYSKLIAVEKQVFIRNLINRAIDEYGCRISPPV